MSAVFEYDGCGDFEEVLSVVCIDNKCGFIDKLDSEVVPLQYDYDYAYEFCNGFA